MTEPARTPLKLFSPRAIGLATFLGSPLAGAALWGINDHRLGKTARAWGIVGVGALAVLVLMIAGSFVRTGGLIGISVGLTIGLQRAAQAAREQIERERTDLAIEDETVARGLGVALLGALGVMAVAFGFAMFGPDAIQQRVEIRPNAYVYYEGDVTAEDSRALGAALATLGFFEGDHAIDVSYGSTSTGHFVSFVVPESALSPAVEDDFRLIASTLQPTTDPTGTLEVRLCDEMLFTHHTYSAP
jgi:hypothetical protein